MNNNNHTKLKEYLNDMAAVGLIIDPSGFNKLSELIQEHLQHVDGLPMDRLIQFVFNEGAKAGAQQVLKDYRDFIRVKNDTNI